VTEFDYAEFTTTRILDAPRELVWQAWTDPEQLARWWGPRGLTTPVETVELDPRPGGAFRLTMVSEKDGTEFPTEMEFREVEEPERIVYGWDAQRGLGAGEVTVILKDLGDKTEMITHYAGYGTDAIRKAAEAGWASQVDRLEELLSEVLEHRE
jgi:uncharacterized protein YndB with AHSA1/START domain